MKRQYTIDDLKFMADSCRLFKIKCRPGVFYIERCPNFPSDCNFVHLFDNGMNPGACGPWGALANYLSRVRDMITFLNPDPINL